MFEFCHSGPATVRALISSALLIVLAITEHVNLAKAHDVQISRFPIAFAMEGSGFHRKLQYNISYDDVLIAAQCTKAEKAVLIQVLPREAFIDPYELSDAFRHSGSLSFRLFGPVELEQPAPGCPPISVAISMDAASWGPASAKPAPAPSRDGSGEDADAQCGVVAEPAAGVGCSAAGPRDAREEEDGDGMQCGVDGVQALQVPVHARYYAPLEKGAAGGEGLWVLSETSTVQLEAPWLLVKCAGPLSSWTLLQGSSSETEDADDAGSVLKAKDGVEWVMPAGSLAHEALVAWGTFAATLAASLCVGYHAITAQF